MPAEYQNVSRLGVLINRASALARGGTPLWGLRKFAKSISGMSFNRKPDERNFIEYSYGRDCLNYRGANWDNSLRLLTKIGILNNDGTVKGFAVNKHPRIVYQFIENKTHAGESETQFGRLFLKCDIKDGFSSEFAGATLRAIRKGISLELDLEDGLPEGLGLPANIRSALQKAGVTRLSLECYGFLPVSRIAKSLRYALRFLSTEGIPQAGVVINIPMPGMVFEPGGYRGGAFNFFGSSLTVETTGKDACKVTIGFADSHL